MRVLLCSDLYPPFIGGLERHVQNLAKALVRRGHRVTVATMAHPGVPPYENDDGVRVHRLAGWSRVLEPLYVNGRPYHPTLPDPGIVRRLDELIAVERPDVVDASGWFVYSVLAGARGGPPVVVTLLDYSLTCVKKNLVHDGGVCDGAALSKCVGCAKEQYGLFKATALTTGLQLSRRMHGRVSRFIAGSEAVRQASLAAAAGRPIDVIPTFIADPPEDPAGGRRPDFLPPGDGYVLFVGALGAYKGLDVLLDAHRRRAHDVPLVVVGTPRDDTPAHFPDGVFVATDVPNRDVMAAWARCSVGVVPSVWPEPFGQVAVEAMACGKPVIASRVGGLRDVVVDGDTGILVEPGDARALAMALDRFVDEPALGDRLGSAGRERARRFTVSNVVGRIEEVYAAASGVTVAA